MPTVLCTVVILFAKPAPPQEVRVSSRPYTPQSYRFRVNANLVEAGVVVRDHNGHPVAGLTQGDFKIFDDGKEREIASFSVETFARTKGLPAMPAPGSAAAVNTPGSIAQTAIESVKRPRYVALLFDDVHTREGDLMHARVAAKRFVREALQPGDHVGIFTASRTQDMAFTADAPKLTVASERLSAHPRMSENGVAPCPRITPYQAYLIVSMDVTALQAALDEAQACAESPEPGRSNLTTALVPNSITGHIVQVQAEQTWDQAKVISQGTLDMIRGVVGELAKMSGDRVLLLASSGFLAETLEYEQSRIIDEALANNVVINALDAKGLFSDTPVRTPDQLQYLSYMPLTTTIFEARTQLSALETANTPLINLAQSTGGLFFHNSNDLTLGFQELAAVPEITYRLGFQPGEGGEGRYHRLQVKLRKPGSYLVQARRGYFAPANGPDQLAVTRQELDREVSASAVRTDFPASVKVELGAPKSGYRLVWVSVHVDLKQMPFTERDGHHLQGITFITALADANGNVVAAKEGRMDLELGEASFTRMTTTGVNAKLSLDVPPGAYRLREVVQEGVNGKIVALNQTVEVPR